MWRNRLDVEVAVGLRGAAAGLFQWDVSNWDAGAGWGGIEPTFHVLDNAAVESLAIKRGRPHAKQSFSAATAAVAVAYTASTDTQWSFRGASPFQIGAELRIRARVRNLDGSIATEWLPLYRGTIRRVKDAFSPFAAFRVTLNLVGRMADLGAVDLPEQSLVGLGDTTDARLNRILGLAGIDEYYGRFDASLVEHQSSNFAQNLLGEAQKVVASEGGGAILHEDAEGFLRFRGREWYAGSVPIELTWTNSDAAVTNEPALVPEKFDTGQDLDDVENYVTLARAGGTATTVQDTDSQLLYAIRTHQRYDLTLRYDADVTTEANYRLAEFKDRTDRVDAIPITVNPLAPLAQIEALLEAEIGDRHAVKWYDSEFYLEGSLFVQGVEHRIDGELWRTTINLWAYGGYGVGVPIGWGGDEWGTATWQIG